MSARGRSGRAVVVVVTWQAAPLLAAHLPAVLNDVRRTPGVTLLVVDNGSTDGTTELLATGFPDVEVLRLERNRGFAGGVAAALELITTPVVILLNNDAEPEPGAVAALLAPLEGEAPQRLAGTTAHVVLNARVDGGPGTLVNSTGNFVDADGNGYDRGWLEPDGARRYAEDVFGVYGGACALRTAAVASVGGICADYFLYYEDTDLSWRLRRAGWSVRYVAEARVRHEHAASSRVGSDLFRYHNARNRLLTVLRNAPAQLVLRAFVRFSAGLLRDVLRDPRGAVIRCQALVSAARQLPAAIRVRRSWPLLDPSPWQGSADSPRRVD